LTRIVAMILLAAANAVAQPVAPVPITPAEEFPACLTRLRTFAAGQGIREGVVNGALRGVELDPSVIDAMTKQPEFQVPIWDYMAGLVDERRILDGREQLARWEALLTRIERSYAVDRHVVLAIWGIESNYGRITGRRPLVRSLATASCFGHRQQFFRGELMAVLEILQSGDIDPRHLKGSWAGAFGQTQFMPSTYKRIAVDFDGDGRRDIVDSIPDALASTARYLQQAGWEPGRPWGFEVVLPAGYDGPSGRRARDSIEGWKRRGVKRADGAPLEGEGRAALLLPAGVRGPAFLVTPNFEAIVAYNNAVSYALSIAHLSDRLRGGAPFVAPWPTDDPGLSRAERVEVQERLAARGFDVGEADGLIGNRTRDAIELFQRSAGLQPDGHAGQRLLQALRTTPYAD
jgi:lytic murein transglycosylase